MPSVLVQHLARGDVPYPQGTVRRHHRDPTPVGTDPAGEESLELLQQRARPRVPDPSLPTRRARGPENRMRRVTTCRTCRHRPERWRLLPNPSRRTFVVRRNSPETRAARGSPARWSACARPRSRAAARVPDSRGARDAPARSAASPLARCSALFASRVRAFARSLSACAVPEGVVQPRVVPERSDEQREETDGADRDERSDRGSALRPLDDPVEVAARAREDGLAAHEPTQLRLQARRPRSSAAAGPSRVTCRRSSRGRAGSGRRACAAAWDPCAAPCRSAGCGSAPGTRAGASSSS